MALVDDLIKQGWLKTPAIIEAFRKIKREDFLPSDKKDLAGLNTALPIGWGQTISQPLVVAFMLELLQPNTGDRVLDIGAGSGWTTALLAELVGKKGKVIGLEIIPELAEFARKNVSKYNFIKRGVVEVVCADGSKGWQEQAPYDKILASASAKEIPQHWQKQLKTGGRIVASMGQSIVLWVKKAKNQFEKKEFPGFVFVPFVNHNEV